MTAKYLYRLLLVCWLFYGYDSSGKIGHRSQPGGVDVPETISVRPAKAVSSKDSVLQQKYARYLNSSPDSVINTKLYAFIEKWADTPYKWGGTDKNGIDCSAFLQRLMLEVYDIDVPRTSMEQLLADGVVPFRRTRKLAEGDILFFRTMNNKLVSHVGIYLHNNMFVNSSSTKGVSIASLDDSYWKKRFIAAGKIKRHVLKK